LRVVVSERVACLVMSRRKGAVRRVAEESILNVRVSTGGYELSLGLECRVTILSRVTESLAKDEAISLERGLAQPLYQLHDRTGRAGPEVRYRADHALLEIETELGLPVSCELLLQPRCGRSVDLVRMRGAES
jgi:hypothetical protein